MCGIAGIWTKKGEGALGSRVKSMCDSMHQRGPDDEGYVAFGAENYTTYAASLNGTDASGYPYLKYTPIKDSLAQSSRLMLGFRRLSILDLSDKGHQPMSDKEGKFWLIFNGELYNYKELRDELKSHGYQFHSNSDTEVVLKSYMHWGEHAFTRFNGQYAMAIYREEEKQLVLVRDRIGIKPLYYYQNDEHLVFGSTIRSLIESGIYTPEIDEKGLQQNFVFAISQRPRTAFRKVVSLEPAHYLKIDLNTGAQKNVKYWDIPLGTQNYQLTEKKAIELLEEKLLKSVDYRLNADVEVGTFMSGGIDSTLISSMAGSMHKGIKAFTLGVDDKYGEFNEIEQAAANAKLNGLEHIVSIVKPDEIVNHLDAVVEGYEEPYHHLPVNFLISRLVHQNGIKVVLNGLGGDELFAGYDEYSKLARWERIKMLPKFGKLLPSGMHEKTDKLKKFSNISTIGEYYAHYYSSFEQQEINRLFERPTPNIMRTIEEVYNPDNLEFSDDMEALSYYNMKSYIGSHHVRTIDQFTMQHSIEGRFPMLDHELVEFAFTVPGRLKIHNGKQKYILRKLAKKYIAPECLQMKKKGFSLPLKDFIDGSLHELVKDSLSDLRKRKLFQQEGLESIITKNDAAQIWHLVMTELWCRHYIDKN
jgi:asparagine synthase (glutamine-hydrolysing)